MSPAWIAHKWIKDVIRPSRIRGSDTVSLKSRTVVSPIIGDDGTFDQAKRDVVCR
jgi:hypothetical protein